MRYLFVAAVLLAAACSVPPMTPPAESRADAVEPRIPESSVIRVTAPRELAPQQPGPKTSPCAGISTGDPVEDTRAKLNCIDLHIGK